MRLQNKVCLITGAGKGIGAATAQLFAREGAVVEIGDIDTDAVHATVQAIEQCGGRAFGSYVDVTDETSIASWKKGILEHHGKVDVLFNNAGISAVGELHQISRDTWDRVLNVNVTGIFLVSREFIPIMLSQKCGSIINMSSSIAHTGLLKRTAYAATKGAVLAMTKSMQVDYAPRLLKII